MSLSVSLMVLTMMMHSARQRVVVNDGIRRTQWNETSNDVNRTTESWLMADHST